VAFVCGCMTLLTVLFISRLSSRTRDSRYSQDLASEPLTMGAEDGISGTEVE
jgi:hypothetical protein